MTTGCIWGFWDGWHAGMQASMEHAMRQCDGDELHVIVIGDDGRSLDAEIPRADLQDRRNDVSDRAEAIESELGLKVKRTFHVYDTLTEAIADGGSCSFEVLFAVAKDQLTCGPFDMNVGILQAARTVEGRGPATIEIMPTVNEPGTEKSLGSTRRRKRAKINSKG